MFQEDAASTWKKKKKKKKGTRRCQAPGCAGGSRLSAKERAMTGADASSRRTKGRSGKRPVIPGICGDSGGWDGRGWWQNEPTLGPRSDVEFCTQVHSSSLQGWYQMNGRSGGGGPGLELATKSAGEAGRG